MLDPKIEAQRLLAELRADLDELIRLHKLCLQGSSAFAAINQQAEGGSQQVNLMLATKEMQEMNQSFNQQYLHIQQKMQSDNRQFTLLSNIMKTKHDTAKNAINNVR